VVLLIIIFLSPLLIDAAIDVELGTFPDTRRHVNTHGGPIIQTPAKAHCMSLSSEESGYC
jgi:hypothetical protein